MSDASTAAPGAVTDRAATTGRPVALVVGELITDAQTLVRKEIELARTEISQEVSKLVKGIVFILVAAFLGIFVLAFVGVTIAKAFDTFMPEWLAWLATTGLFTLIAGLLAFLAYRKISTAHLAPTQAQESVRETTQWVRTQIKR